MILHYFLAAVLLAAPAAAQTNWALSWSDEFDGSAVDTTKWNYDLGGGGWGNNELQCYTNTPTNAAVANGMLTITARREAAPPNCNNREYTSARLLTAGRFSQTYGRFEMRAKLPRGEGIWPAFWMLGNDIGLVGWPRSGEIDIMENIGKEPSIVHGTIHGPGHSGGNAIGGQYSLPGGAKFADDFHTYAVEWEPNAIRWYVDGTLYQTRTPADLPSGATWVYNKPFFLLLNLAVGGNWPGNPDTTTVFPQEYVIDYVRVYKQANVVNGASFRPVAATGSWMTVLGDGMSATTRDWTGAIDQGRLPTELDGVRVLVNGTPAYLNYISPTQINAQMPEVAPGTVTVEVMNGSQQVRKFFGEADSIAPAWFLWLGKYAVATIHPDYVAVGRPGLFEGRATRPAQPGDIIILWGTGFGATSPAVPAGQLVEGAPSLLKAPIVTIGGKVAEYVSGVLSPGFAGLYQIAVKVPSDAPEGEVPVIADVANVQTPAALLTVAR